MPRAPRAPRASIAALAAVALAIAAAHDAGAREFQMSGTWELRRGRSVFLPLQFATLMQVQQKSPFAILQTGTMGYGFPHEPVPGLGGVSATGSAPATLLVPAHRFGGEFGALIPLNGYTLVQVTTDFDLDGPAAPASLAPGGGPESFTWCPGDPDCTAASAPLRQAGTRGQRIVYRAGPNRFGGVMRMLLRGGAVNSSVFDASPFRVFHNFGNASWSQQTGAPYASVAMHQQPRGFVTQPTIPPAMGSPVLHPGPKVTTMLGLTDTGTGAVLYLPGVATSMGGQAGRITTSTGFPWTTGTVFVQQTGYSDTLWELMGSDQRTPLGAGNIALVAGGLAHRSSFNLFEIPRVSFGRVRMTFAPPIPSLSPAGLAAGAALVLLAVGYALGRRRGPA